MFRPNNRHRQQQLCTTLDSLPERQLERLEASWAGVFYRECFSRLDEQVFGVLYSDKDSRPNIPVNVLVGLEALKAAFNWSDEQLYDAFCFDLQVRFALGYRNLGEGQLDLRTLYYFRNRLSAHFAKTGQDLIERSFEQVTDAQLSGFGLKTGKVRMDSTQIASNIRVMSRLHLLVEVLQRVHRMLGELDQARYQAEFGPYLQGTSNQYVYRVRSEEGAEHLLRIGQLMSQLLGVLQPLYGQDPTYQMLERVFGEHYLVEQARVRLKSGKELRASSLQSPDDQEATYRRKAGREYHGYVANLTETCDPDNPLQLIAKVQTGPNSTNDDDLLVAALPSLKARLCIDEVHTDGAYNSDESDAALREHQVTLVQTAIGGHAPKTHLGLDLFELALSPSAPESAPAPSTPSSNEPRPATVRCPGGQTAAVETVETKAAKRRYRAYFDSAQCADCPFQPTCLAQPCKSLPRRTLSFDAHDAEVARRRQRLRQDRLAGRNLRVVIESTIGSLKQPFNYGQLPVRGRFRVGMLLVGAATIANIRRIQRYLYRKPAPKGPNASAQALREAQEAHVSLFSPALDRLARLLCSPRHQPCSL
jgi:Transposase DDE domain/Transposase domain (DUF772)